MALWLISPAATPLDDRWQGREIFRSVVVEAPTAAAARLAAEHWALGGTHPEMSNESLNAGFSDEKLYFVRPAPPDMTGDGENSDGDSHVLAATPLR
jgi:hypothetical protein